MLMEQLSPKIERLDQGTEPTFGVYCVEPLERGYGTTLGNALRRVLLSSLPGAAVTHVRIGANGQDVAHEFSVIPGVVEDVIEVLLNLKELALRVKPSGEALADMPHILRLDRRGGGEISGADLDTPPEVEVVNRDLHIATLEGADVQLTMELHVSVGKGYVPADEHSEPHTPRPIGLIPLDAMFTPVRHVAYRVEPTRVGRRTDFDRLILEVRTTGALTPDEAVSEAAKIFDRYVLLFFDLGQPAETMTMVAPEDIPARRMRVDELDFSVRTSNCLKRAGVVTLGDLVDMPSRQLMKIRNFGQKSFEEVKEKLAQFNLTLKEEGDEAPREGAESEPAPVAED